MWLSLVNQILSPKFTNLKVRDKEAEENTLAKNSLFAQVDQSQVALLTRSGRQAGVQPPSLNGCEVHITLCLLLEPTPGS